MSYIGKEPADSFISFAKQDFTTSATTSYTLDNAVTNENELALFINFVRQEPTTAYTASGTTLTLTSATASTDDMYCVYLGQAKQTVNAPDGSVGSSQVASTIITGQTAETSIATDDTVLIHDTSAGALRKMTRANFVSGLGGVTHIDQWYLSSNQTYGSSGAVTLTGFTQNTEKFTTLGSSMSESSGIWTFPTTGYWMICPTFYLQNNNGTALVYLGGLLHTTNNNSTYTAVLQTYSSAYTNGAYASPNFTYVMDVTDTSNDKCKILVEGQGGWIAEGGNHVKTGVKFIRLGDT